jgi:hypothetical protein
VKSGPEKERIAREGTEEEQLALANDPDSSDAVLLLLKGTTFPKVLEAAVKHSHTDETLVALLEHAPEWLPREAAALARSDETLLGETFAKSSRPGDRAAAATHFRDDEHRVILLDDRTAQVRIAAVEAMKSAEPLRAHLEAETSPGVFKETAKHIRNTALARIRALEAPQPQQAKPPQAQVIL